MGGKLRKKRKKRFSRGRIQRPKRGSDAKLLNLKGGFGGEKE